MNDVITSAIQQSGGRFSQVGHYARTTWTLCYALIAVAAGVSTLNMAVADTGIATLSEVVSPLMQQCARFGRQA